MWIFFCWTSFANSINIPIITPDLLWSCMSTKTPKIPKETAWLIAQWCCKWDNSSFWMCLWLGMDVGDVLGIRWAGCRARNDLSLLPPWGTTAPSPWLWGYPSLVGQLQLSQTHSHKDEWQRLPRIQLRVRGAVCGSRAVLPQPFSSVSCQPEPEGTGCSWGCLRKPWIWRAAGHGLCCEWRQFLCRVVGATLPQHFLYFLHFQRCQSVFLGMIVLHGG